LKNEVVFVSFLKTGQIDVLAELSAKARAVNSTLKTLLDDNTHIQPQLKEALAYALESPGKRLRAALVLWSCQAVSGQINRNAQIASAAVEIVHTYSLIHDDLPAMDDDDLRRGRASCHKQFDEATAILTGDALLTLAFEILAERIDEPALAVKLISQLARAAGAEGMVAGQMADISAVFKAHTDYKDNPELPDRLELLQYIHTHKTARMFRCAAICGAMTANASPRQIDQLSNYGLKLGLAFQIADDILDVSSTPGQLGKTPGKDARQSKLTYPALLGLQKSKDTARKLAANARDALSSFGHEAALLRKLPLVLLDRTK